MKRVVTSLILIPVITWVVLFAPDFVFAATVCLFAALCWMEFAGIAVHYGARFTALAGNDALAAAEARIRAIALQPADPYPTPSGDFRPLTGRPQP